MQNRKKMNQAIERQKTGKRRLSQLIAGIIIAAIVAAIVWIVWDVQSRRWIVEFEGRRIATSELQLHGVLEGMDHTFGPDQAFLVDSIVQAEVLLQKAREAGIYLTEEEREITLAMAEANHELFPNIPVERVAELLSLDFSFTTLLQRVMAHYATYEPDPFAFAAEFTEYVENHRADYELRSTVSQVILSDNRDALVAVQEAAPTTPEAFEALARELVFTEDEQGVFEAPIMSFVEWFGLLDNSGELFGLQEGEMSSIIDVGDGEYILVLMTSRPGITDGEIEAMYRERIVIERGAEAFMELLDTWTQEANYRVNQRAMAR